MPTREEFIREVTDFFNAEKALVGIDEPLTWQPNRDPSEHCLKIPIEIDGVQFGQQLVIVSRPGSATLDFSLVVIHGVAVCRLDFDETGGHTNSFSSHIDALPVQVVGSHFHRWSVNTRFVENDIKLLELRNAEKIPPAIKNFDACLRWFCDETKISLPHNHQISLPPGGLI